MSLDHWITGGDNPGRAWEQHRDGDVPPDQTGRCLCGDYAGGSVVDVRGYPMCAACQRKYPDDIWQPSARAVGLTQE